MHSTINTYRLLFWILLIVSSGKLIADPGREFILDYATYMELVKTYHPVAVQAGLRPAEGDALLLSSRGAFDPLLFSDISQKYFDENQYYSIIQGGVEIPTWLGVEINAGYEINRGAYLNPEHNVPETGLWFAGLSIPLGRGLLIDKRRAELRKAELYSQSAEFTRMAMINELLYNAGLTYIDWQRTFRAVQVYQEALDAVESRLTIVRTWALAGDTAPIDTTEALIQVQNMTIALREAQLKFMQASADLNVFLWGEDRTPLELSPGVSPDTIELNVYLENGDPELSLIEERIQLHPEIRNLQIQMDQFEIDKRLIRESLKPEFDLKYNLLARNGSDHLPEQVSFQNYNWGLQFSMPLFLRQARGRTQAVELKIQNTELEYATMTQTFQNKVLKAYNEWLTTNDQIDIYAEVVDNYKLLLDSEVELLRIGESSLFLVNSRTAAYIQAQLKMIDLKVSNLKARLMIEYYLATLN